MSHVNFAKIFKDQQSLTIIKSGQFGSALSDCTETSTFVIAEISNSNDDLWIVIGRRVPSIRTSSAPFRSGTPFYHQEKALVSFEVRCDS